MKKILLSTVAFAGLTAGAMAADLPMRTAPPAPAPMAAIPVFTWTGFYVGVNAGYAFSDNEVSRGTLRTPDGDGDGTGFLVTGVTRDGGNNDDGGFTGGGQIGYNMQFGMFVAGLEADIQYIDLGGDNRGGGIRTANVVGPQPVGAFGIGPVVGTSGGNVAFFDRRQEMDFFGTVRGRLGVAFDRALIYATGGLAWTSLDDENGVVPGVGFFQGPNAEARRQRAVRIANRAGVESDDIGWTVGGGVEYAFTNNISAKIEGLYVNIGDTDGSNIVGVTNRGRLIRERGGDNNNELGEFAVVRAGLNFRFGTW